MARYSLYIGNKNYSSWSMRPWVVMKQAGIEFTEVKLRFDSFEPDSTFKRSLQVVSPTTAKVPLLIDHNQADLAVWDSLAICEYLAEQHPEKSLWPTDLAARAQARSLCAEMHVGFKAFREYFAMNIEASLPDIGQIVLRDQPSVVDDLQHLITLWTAALTQLEGGFLFGNWSIVDAYYAPMCLRLRTYGIEVPDIIKGYLARVESTQGVLAWVSDALAEEDFVVFEEPYRLSR